MAAINFSTASFAACLAAGFKVPPHVMYCIAQDAGTPYMIYNKDGSVQAGAGMGQSAQWSTQAAGPTGYAFIAPGNGQTHFQLQAAPAPLQIQTVSTSTGNNHNAAPVISEAVTHPANSEPDEAARDSTPQQSVSEDQQNNVSTRPDSNNQAQPTSPSSGTEHYYSSQARPPSTLLTPSSLISYLKQPGVMLSPINATEFSTSTGTQSEFPLNMPDLIAQNAHVRTTKDLRLFKCDTCGRAFRQKATLQQHERIHTDSRPYACADCGKRFRQQSHLSQHVRIHANEKPYNYNTTINAVATGTLGPGSYKKSTTNSSTQAWSQECNSYPSSDKDSGYDNSEQSAPCYSPDTSAAFPAYYKDEKGVAHGIFNEDGKCLPDVIQNGKSAGMPLYVRCPICQKEFKQKSTLLQHGCVHIESRPYPCGDCGKRFRQQSHLVQHLRIHNDEKPYTCIYCGRQFRQRTILNQHTRIHTGEKPYKCIHCGKDFRQKAILDQHTRTHTGERPFCCPLPNCRRRFCTEGEVKRHIDNHMTPNNRRTKRSVSMESSLSEGTVNIKPELYFGHNYPASGYGVPYEVQTSPQNQAHNGDYTGKTGVT